jgi:hypothetical protein
MSIEPWLKLSLAGAAVAEVLVSERPLSVIEVLDACNPMAVQASDEKDAYWYEARLDEAVDDGFLVKREAPASPTTYFRARLPGGSADAMGMALLGAYYQMYKEACKGRARPH